VIAERVGVSPSQCFTDIYLIDQESLRVTMERLAAACAVLARAEEGQAKVAGTGDAPARRGAASL